MNKFNHFRSFLLLFMYFILSISLAFNFNKSNLEDILSINICLTKAQKILDYNNYGLTTSIRKNVEAYPNRYNKDFDSKIDSIEIYTKDFCQYIESIKKQIYDEAGGPSLENPMNPMKNNNYNISSKVLLNTINSNQKLNGLELEKQILDYYDKLFLIADNDLIVKNSILEEITDFPDRNKKLIWIKNKFVGIPVAAAFPLLAQVELEGKKSANKVLQYLNEKVTIRKRVYDSLSLNIAPEKNFVILGDSFKANIYLQCYTSNPGENTSFKVNGNNIKVQSGKATYLTNFEKVGIKTLKAEVITLNDFTGEIDLESAESDFEVVEHAISVTPTLNNILFIGIDNPIHIISPGISSKKIKVIIMGNDGASIVKKSNGDYTIKVNKETKEGELCTISATGQGFSDSQKYKIRYLPDPETKCGKFKSGDINASKFKSIKKIDAPIESLAFDINCKVNSFSITRIDAGNEFAKVHNEGENLTSNATQLIKRAKAGNVYIFENIKASCPGDTKERTLNPLVFTIK